MRRIYLLLLSMLFPCLMYAQEPGIMGRRFLIAAQGASSFVLNKAYNYDLSFHSSPVFILPGLRFEYIRSRSNTLLLEFVPIRSALVDKSEETIIRERCLGVGFHGKTYAFANRGNLAPMGMFFEYGLNGYYLKSGRIKDNRPLAEQTGLAIRPVVGLGNSFLVGRLFYEICIIYQFLTEVSDEYISPNKPNFGLRLSVGFL